MASLYQILELPNFSSREEVKKQYKKLALQYHPDKNPGGGYHEERFKLMTRAYTILSDPKKKAGYDHLLIIRAHQPKSSKPPKRPEQSYSFKQEQVPEVKSSYPVYLIVFIFFGLGFFIYQGIWQANNYRISKKIEQEKTTRDILLDKSVESFQQGNVKLALDYLDMVQWNSAGEDIRQLREHYISSSEERASELMRAGNFSGAVDLLSTLITRARSAKEEWYVGLAICYKGIGKIRISIEILEKLVGKNPNLLMANKELGHIYKNDLIDFDKALFYYERATAIIVNNYVDYYGKAYYVIINPENHPPSDYSVFIEKAKIYASMNKPKKAIDACKWAEVLEPENPAPNIIMGQTYFELGNYKEACKALEKAEEKGAALPEELENIQC